MDELLPFPFLVRLDCPSSAHPHRSLDLNAVLKTHPNSNKRHSLPLPLDNTTHHGSVHRWTSRQCPLRRLAQLHHPRQPTQRRRPTAQECPRSHRNRRTCLDDGSRLPHGRPRRRPQARNTLRPRRTPRAALRVERQPRLLLLPLQALAV